MPCAGPKPVRLATGIPPNDVSRATRLRPGDRCLSCRAPPALATLGPGALPLVARRRQARLQMVSRWSPGWKGPPLPSPTRSHNPQSLWHPVPKRPGRHNEDYAFAGHLRGLIRGSGSGARRLARSPRRPLRTRLGQFQKLEFPHRRRCRQRVRLPRVALQGKVCRPSGLARPGILACARGGAAIALGTHRPTTRASRLRSGAKRIPTDPGRQV